MVVEQRFPPASPRPDLRPIRPALTRLLHTCPDRFALASMGIREVCRNVRSWLPRRLTDGVGWHAKFVFPGVIIDFVYGWTSGVERLVFVKLGCPQPDQPCDLLLHVGFVMLDPSGRPYILAPGQPVALQLPLHPRPSHPALPRGDDALRHLGNALLAELLSIAAYSVEAKRIAPGIEPARRAFVAKPWLPQLCLPAHVPRPVWSTDWKRSRPLVESIWEFAMTYHHKHVTAVWPSGIGCALGNDADDDFAGLPGDARSDHHRDGRRSTKASIANCGTAWTAVSVATRSQLPEQHAKRRAQRGWASIDAIIASVALRRSSEARPQ